MSHSDKPSNDHSNEGAVMLPGSFIGLYSDLMKKGWKQSPDVTGGQNEKAGRRNRTVEVQRMILEKQCTNNKAIEKIQIIMMLQDGKVECQMYTKPFMSAFFKTSIKDMEHLSFLLQEIDDYYGLLNPPERVRKIQEGVRESMRTTQKFVLGKDGILRVEKK